MADYVGVKCPVCQQSFNQDDDIVVCPICGTPHHRECYKSLGHCKNEEWHEQNKSFDVNELKSDEPQIDEQEKNANSEHDKLTVCERCGQQISDEDIFCKRCGAPVSKGFAASQNPQDMQGRAFFPNVVRIDADDELDGVAVWKLSAVVKQNQLRFIPTFKMFSQNKSKINFNFCAFFFSLVYLLYRRVYSWGIVALIAQVILTIPSLILNFTSENLTALYGVQVDFGLNLTAAQTSFLNTTAFVCMILSFVIELLIGLFANYLYYKKCLKLCKKIDSESDGSREDFLNLAFKKGGVDKLSIIILGAAYMLSTYVIMYLMMI